MADLSNSRTTPKNAIQVSMVIAKTINRVGKTSPRDNWFALAVYNERTGKRANRIGWNGMVPFFIMTAPINSDFSPSLLNHQSIPAGKPERVNRIDRN